MSASKNEHRQLYRGCLFATVYVALTAGLIAQQASANTVSSALNATFGKTRPRAITMTGFVTVYGGAKPEQGKVKLLAKDNGESRVLMTLASGERDEESWEEGKQQRCRTSSAGKEDTRITPNCWQSTPWFFPQMAMLENMQTSTETADLGVMNEDGTTVHVIGTSRIPDARFKNSADGMLIKSWSKSRLRLEPESLLPSSFSYSLYGDRSVRTTITAKVLFSDYRSEQGILIAHHIQRFLNNALQADILISSVEIK